MIETLYIGLSTPHCWGKAVDINFLYQTARNGDKQAEEQLFSVLAVRFGILANHRIWNEQDAEDVVQNALAVVAREYKGTVISVSFAAWAYKVLDNRMLSYFKGTRQDVTVADNDPPDMSGTEPMFKIRLLDCVKKVRRAHAKYGQAVLLHYQGYTTREVCERLGVTSQNFYMILSRARVMLKRCLETGEVS